MRPDTKDDEDEEKPQMTEDYVQRSKAPSIVGNDADSSRFLIHHLRRSASSAVSSSFLVSGVALSF